MAGNLRNALTGGSVLPRGCLTPRARILTDLMNRNAAYEIGGSNNNAFSSPKKTEIQNKHKIIAGYNDARNREDTPSMTVPAPQESVRIQDTQVNSTDDMLASAERKAGDNDDSLTLQETGVQDVRTRTTGDSHNLSKDHHGQGFLQFGSGQTFGLGALQGRTDCGRNLFGRQGYGSDAYGLSTGANTFFDWMLKGVRDFVQSEVGRSVRVSGMDEWLSKEDWRSGLEAIKQTNVRQLTEAAAKIMGILSIVVGGAEIAALNITLGLCVVAQEVQEERRKEKERLEGLNDPKWDEPAIKAELERQVPIWFRNKATEFFVGEWLGKIAKFITNDKVGGFVIDQSREMFPEWYKRMLIEWEEYDKTMDAESRIDSWTKIIKEEYKE